MKIDLYSDSGKLISSVQTQKSANASFEECLIAGSVLDAAGRKLSIKCSVPIIDMHGFWTPDMFRPKLQLDWLINFTCAAHRNFPYISFFNMAQVNRASIGLSNLFDDADITAKMNQETGNYDLEFVVSLSPDTEEFKVFADFGAAHWTESLSKYRRFVRPDWSPAYPEAAWNPVYCTWYAVHAAVEKSWLERNAEAAAKLGMGTFIVDDGWCIDDVKRVCPETIASWYDKIGDWQVSDRKLPAFKQHVEKVQALGMKYMLWVSPFMVGVRSRLYAVSGCDYLSDEHEGYRVFDPADEKISSASMANLLRLMTDYGIDGLKIDFVDAVPQSVDAPHGRDSFNYMKKLISGMRSCKSDALIEFRQRYTTPVMLDLATQFRAGDVPFDFVENIHRIAQIRMILGDAVPVHADPVYWNNNETPENISRHMIASLAGVPMVSMDLPALPEAHLRIISHWLGFYNKHLETFRTGHWTICYDADHLSSVSVEAEKEKIVILCSGKIPENIGKKLHVLNFSGFSVPMKNSLIFDCSGEHISNDEVPCGGRAEL